GALVQNIILNFALEDRVVLMERGGNFLLQTVPHAYRIRVIAPLEARVDRISMRESVDTYSARLLAKRTDKERGNFAYSMFGKTWDDPAGFDEVFDTAKQPIPHIIDRVVGVLNERDGKKTDEAENDIRMRAMAAKIKAHMFMNPKLLAPTLDVEVEGRGLVLTGIVRGPKHLERIKEESLRLAGDIPIRFSVHYKGLSDVRAED
ncbi:MAG: cytidylate kinase family protein, partial [Pseudomonadota bacterium]